MRIKTVIRAILAGFAVLLSTAQAANLVTDSNGLLLGATGVAIGNSSYSVAFVDGTCAALFSGCNDPADFDFTTEADATIAAQALFDQVFVGAFDVAPELTFGCPRASVFSQCVAIVPYAIDPTDPGTVFWSRAINHSLEANDRTAIAFAPTLSNTSISTGLVYVDFAFEGPIAPVPLPAAAPLFLAGLGSVAAIRRRRPARRQS